MSASGDRARIGFVYLIAQLGMVLTVAGVLHLGVLPQETILNIVILAILGIILTILAIAVKGGNFLPSIPGAKTLAVAVGGFVVLLLVNMGLAFFFDAPMFSSIGSADWGSKLMVNILAAICEEDLFFGVYCVAKVVNLPDVWIMFLSTLVFWALHALVYNIYAWEMVVFLSCGRLVLTGMYAVSDHSDPSFIVHILWNVINT